MKEAIYKIFFWIMAEIIMPVIFGITAATIMIAIKTYLEWHGYL